MDFIETYFEDLLSHTSPFISYLLYFGFLFETIMEALTELQNALNLYAGYNDLKTWENAYLMYYQYRSSLLLECVETCTCGTIMCQQSRIGLNSVLRVLERTENVDTAIYDVIQKALLCADEVSLVR